jgi:hypothetical protein
MNAQDKRLIEAMQRELDELMVEEQIHHEVQDRIRAAHQPPTPYEMTPAYLAEQAAIESELAVARELRKASKGSHAATSASTVNFVVRETIPELRKLREELELLEPLNPFDDDIMLPYQSFSASLRSNQSAHVVMSDEASVAMLSQALEKGRQRRSTIKASRETAARRTAENVRRLSKHARDLEAAREAAAIADAYEKEYNTMRARLRYDVLIGAFGDNAFRPLSPIRVEQADLFDEFPYRDDKDFGLCSDPSASLDDLLDFYRQQPQVWCFFANRCSPVMFDVAQRPLATAEQQQLERSHCNGAQLVVGAEEQPQSTPEGLTFHQCGCSELSDVVHTDPEVTPPSEISAPHAEVPEGIRVCREALAAARGPLEALVDEQRYHEDAQRARREAAERLKVSNAHRSSVALRSMNSSMGSGSLVTGGSTLGATHVFQKSLDIQVPSPVKREADEDDTPMQFAEELPETISRYLSIEIKADSVGELRSATDPSMMRPRLGDASFHPEDQSSDMLISVNQPSVVPSTQVGRGNVVFFELDDAVRQQRRDTGQSFDTRGHSTAVTQVPSVSSRGYPSSYKRSSLSRRSLSKILKFNPDLDDLSSYSSSCRAKAL